MREALDSGWRLASLALAWTLAVALQLQQRSLSDERMAWASIALGLLGVLVGWRWRRAFWFAVAGVALIAFGLTDERAHRLLDDALPSTLEDRDIRVTGVIASLPQRSASGLRFRFEVDGAVLQNEPVRIPSLLAVGWMRGWHEDAALNEPQTSLRAGQRWAFTLRLRRPHGNLNPNGFDYELNLFEQGVRATGYVRDAPAPELLHPAAGYPVERLRQRVRDAIEASVPDRRVAGVLAALTVGDQGAIDREDWDLYRNTGIAHLVSISGLHITMFAWLAGLLIAAGWRRSARASIVVPAPIAARWGGLACAAAYALFSGWGVPSQRTIWMLATVTLLQSLGLRWPWMLVLLFAAVVVTAIDPWALMQAGFWLSFVAVGLLMASSSADRAAQAGPRGTPASGWRGRAQRIGARVWHAVRSDLRTQLIATIGLAPLTLVFFQQISLVGFAANLIAIPLITLVITPLAMLGVVLLPLWTLAAAAVRVLNAALGWLVQWPGAVWMVPVAPAWAQLAGLVGAVLLVLPLPWRARLLALPLLLPLCLPPRSWPPPGDFDLIAADVGQGSALLLRTAGHLLVFDAGPQYARESDAGARVLLPLLRARGETRIDRLVLSHRDLDHVGGAASLLKAMPVDELLSSLETGHPLLAMASHTARCNAGQQWVWDGVRFEMLRPTVGDYERSLKANAMSCVLRVSGAGGSVLLTGDLERDQESALLQSLREAEPDASDALRSDVLIVPHHGSRTSSSTAFLAAVQPRIAIVQAGYRNRFGHPSAEVTARYASLGIPLRASPDCGAWQWRAGTPIDGVCERQRAHRYWHDGPAYDP